MAEPLKHFFSPALVEQIADSLVSADPALDRARFIALATDGLDSLELAERGRLIARALSAVLPDDFGAAADVVDASLPAPLDELEGQEMAPFFFLPHVYWVAEEGLEAPERALALQHALTQRFTAEFSIRAYLEHHPALTLATLERWTGDPSHHVRRLVSEGTRPRLPWAPRLRAFQRDPTPVLALLERLKDDPSEYVRRSVANNLNDIGKDHPAVLVDVAARWMHDASPERERLVRHALRSLVKAGNADALAALGHHAPDDIRASIEVTPRAARIGESVTLVALVSSDHALHAPVDFVIHFMKSTGSLRPRVFKGRAIDLAPGDRARVQCTVSLKQHSTRTHYPGRHEATVQVNGRAVARAAFDVRGG